MARTRDIRPNLNDTACDICGRTLLRGEHAETFLASGSRREVCDLCTARAQHEGWIRESGGDDLALGHTRHDGRSGFLDRFRARRRAPTAEGRWWSGGSGGRWSGAREVQGQEDSRIGNTINSGTKVSSGCVSTKATACVRRIRPMTPNDPSNQVIGSA